MIFLQVALNGDRHHPAVPKTLEEIVEDVKEVVHAGAHGVHVHAFDEMGKETLDAIACSRVLIAIRNSCPGVPVLLTTSAAIVADADRRMAIVQTWTEFPDLVTVNQGEEGNLACWSINRRAIERGHGIRTGLEDVAVLPDGRTAENNAQLVRTALKMIQRETL